MNTGQLATVALIAFASASAGYWSARHHVMAGAEAVTETGDRAAEGTHSDRKVLYWYDPMVPDQHFDKPGKSPMGMTMVPRYADEGGSGADAGVRIDPRMMQNFAIRLATVERGVLSRAVEAVGTIGFNQRDVAIVQARAGGFVERVYARAPGDVIRQGAPLVDVLMPDWAGAQDEFIALARSGDRGLLVAGRDRLKSLGMPRGLIDLVERTGRPHPVVTITAPIAGAIQTLGVRAGMTVTAGMTLAEINGLFTVWLDVAVPEAQADRVAIGDAVQARLNAFPGELFSGRIIALLPQTDPASHTLTLRAELPNRDGRLQPGMFAQVHVHDRNAAPVLWVPAEAVIRGGTRNVVVVADHGRFQPVVVETGHESGGRTPILSGLREGQQVVASGQFLIDSEANLNGVLDRLAAQNPYPDSANGKSAEAAADGEPSVLHHATGRVDAIAGDTITLSHGPVPSLGWGAMTMSFNLAHLELAAAIKPLDRVNFDFRREGEKFVIERIVKTGRDP